MTSTIRTLIAAAALILAIAPAATAQTGAVLSGVVHDRTGTPVPGVVLTIVDPAKPEPRVAVTDQRGVYFVDRLVYGRSYAVDVSHPRFRRSQVQAHANEGETPVRIMIDHRRNRFARVALFPFRLFRAGVMKLVPR